ncbi:MAG: alpha/beta hydrolase [Planctomycetota bacterium]
MANRVNLTPDIAYAQIDGEPMLLDLYMPDGVKSPPLVVFIHGGGWRNLDRKRCAITWLPEYGFALASIDYRLSGVAKFPAQIHDAKAAVRFLRANADRFGYTADRIVVTGTSAGAHLATLLAVAAGHPELEGAVGDHADTSSAVQAVVGYFGAYDFFERSRIQPNNTDRPRGSVYQLLGGPVRDHPDRARLASPRFHVGPGDPPLLMLHGLLDRTVDAHQSIRMYQEYRKHDLPVDLRLLHNGVHAGPEFFRGASRQALLEFLHRHLSHDRSDAAP